MSSNFLTPYVNTVNWLV